METYKAQEAPETHNMHKDPFQSCKSSKLEGVLEELQEIVADNPRYCTSHLSPHAGESFGGVAVFQVTQTNPHTPYPFLSNPGNSLVHQAKFGWQHPS